MHSVIEPIKRWNQDEMSPHCEEERRQSSFAQVDFCDYISARIELPIISSIPILFTCDLNGIKVDAILETEPFFGGQQNVQEVLELMYHPWGRFVDE